MVLTFIPEFNAFSAYAGHAGSMTIISSPGCKRVDMVKNTENLAPGETITFSVFVLVWYLSAVFFARASLNSGIPFDSPYFVNPLSYTSARDFLTIFGGSKS